jgi:hypothetical protein
MLLLYESIVIAVVKWENLDCDKCSANSLAFSILSRQPIVASKHCERRPWGCWLMLWLNVVQAIVVVAVVVVVVAVAMFFFLLLLLLLLMF